LRDIEQVNKINDEHRQQSDTRGQRHHGNVPQGAAGEKNGGSLGDNLSWEKFVWPELAIGNMQFPL